jgi:transcription antitermination factor NusA-like protein
MIPKHLVGRSAARIVDEVKRKFAKESHIDYYREYAQQLEMLLLLSVKDALMNAEEIKELIDEGQYNAMSRAIAFLNMVLPYEEKK